MLHMKLYLLDSMLSIVESYKAVANVIETVQGVKLNIDHYHNQWFSKAVKLGEKIDAELKMPRIANISMNRDNTPGADAEEYCRRTVSIKVLDEVSKEL
jgi:hypothetical protein